MPPKGLLSCLLFILLYLPLQAQDPVVSHYMENQLLYNPAWSGVQEQTDINLTAQNLVSTFDSLENKSYALSFNHFAENIRSGFGGYVLYVYEPYLGNYIVFDFSYSYELLQQNDHHLLIGGSLGVGRREDLSNRFNQLPSGAIERNILWYGDLGIGLWYSYRGFFSGIGAKHLNQPRLEHTSTNAFVIDDVYYLLGGYRIEVDRSLSITPSILSRYRGRYYILTDFSAMIDFEKLRIGGAYRVDLRAKPPPNFNNPVNNEPTRQFILSLGASFAENYQLLLSYTQVLNEFVVINRSNFELTFNYQFK